jgi:MFS transporter, Spinster family, sphingosine-1-phosphate transporter
MPAHHNSEESESLVDRNPSGDNNESCIERFVTPRVVLGLFTLVNFITYYDRGVMSSSLSSIRSDSSIAGDGGTISDTKGGFIVSAFMVGFMLTCPLFAALGGTFTAKRIIIVGMLVWAAACIMSGFSHGYPMLLVARMFVGVGEAAFAGYAVTIIDNIAPKASRTRWIGTFYSMIPVGTAIGMAGGGVISTDGGVGSIAGWRVAFFTEVVASAPIILMIGLLPNKYNPRQIPTKNSTLEQPADAEAHVALLPASKALITNIRFVLVVFGYGMYVFVTGAIAVWAISMLTEGPLNLTTVPASLLMGGATAITGVFGSIAGGLFVDRMGGSQGLHGTMKCQLFSVGMMVISVPCGLVALTASDLWLFVVFFVISVFSLFAVTAPVNASILTVVPSNLRTYAISFSVFAIHLMGDFPSPTVAGSLSDKFAHGCPNYNSNITCASVPSENCRWVPPKDHEVGSCVNIYQLRNALAIVYCFLLLAIPAWLVVFVLVRREHRQTLASATLESDNGYNGARSLGTTNSDVESLKSANRFVSGSP